MRLQHSLIGLTLLCACSIPTLAQQAALFDELAPLYPDSKASSGTPKMLSHTPRGATAGVHVLLTDLPPQAAIRCKLLLDNKTVALARVYKLIDVPVEQNTGLVSRTEIWDKQDNPHVNRKAPFRVFEALQPIETNAQANDAGTLALRVEIPIKTNDPAGRQQYTIHLETDSWNAKLEWQLHIYPVSVPPLQLQHYGYTNWFSPSLIAKRHNLKIWSEPFWDMLQRYADLMARGRQNTFWIRWGDFFSVDKQNQAIKLNQSRFNRYVRIFLDRDFTCIEGGHLAHRHHGDWNSPRLNIGLTGADVLGEQGQADLEIILTEVKAALDQLDLPPNVQYLQHLTDEPTDTNAESYHALAGEVRRLLPKVKIFEATMSLTLVNAVDHWCPQIQEYQRHRDFFDARKQAGDRIWVYTCLAPGGPWLNRLLDQERLRPVYLGWSLAKYDLAGFLHWGLNHYRPGVDPLAQSVVPHGQGPPNYLPAGDSHVIYPGPDGPWSGQRFEAQRIGMEDAALLRLLTTRNPAQAESLIAKVFRAYDDYSTSIESYRAVRTELLETLARQAKSD